MYVRVSVVHAEVSVVAAGPPPLLLTPVCARSFAAAWSRAQPSTAVLCDQQQTSLTIWLHCETPTAGRSYWTRTRMSSEYSW